MFRIKWEKCNGPVTNCWLDFKTVRFLTWSVAAVQGYQHREHIGGRRLDCGRYHSQTTLTIVLESKLRNLKKLVSWQSWHHSKSHNYTSSLLDHWSIWLLLLQRCQHPKDIRERGLPCGRYQSQTGPRNINNLDPYMSNKAKKSEKVTSWHQSKSQTYPSS